MKKFSIFLSFLCLLLTGCENNSFSVESYYVSPWRPEGEYTRFEGCLSVDGQTFTFSNLDQINLSSGVMTHLIDDFQSLTDAFPDFLYTSELDCGWASDGTTLAVTNTSEQINGRYHIVQTIIIDTENHTFMTLPDDLGAFEGLSPFTNNLVITIGRNGPNIHVFDLDNYAEVRSDSQVDFRGENELAGSSTTLWSRSINYPVGHLTSTITDPYTVNFWPNLALVSGLDSYPSTPYEYSVILSETPVIGAILDPTGEYVLISEWVCGSVDDNQSCNWDTLSQEDISDTIFTIINWRTGEHQELFRLSDVGDGYYVAYGSNMYWSADGSTVLIERYDASPVVLTVQYP